RLAQQLLVGGEGGRVRADPLDDVGDVRYRPAGRAAGGEDEGGGPCERAGVQAGQRRHGVEPLHASVRGGGRACGAHHLPTRFCPHTRRVCPLTPPACGEARNATASATSTGWPPCWRELARRAICRGTVGIRAVMSVSMNPGATAFAVPPSSAIRGASASTIPRIPALAVA